MKNSNPHAANIESKIQCIEVLVSRRSIAKNLQWTLSVYSLENNPVSAHPSIHNCDVYHFMNFDWKRTIRQLLDDHEIAYTIIQHFSAETIHAGIERNLPFNEKGIVSGLQQMEETPERPAASYGIGVPSSIRHQDRDLVFHRESV